MLEKLIINNRSNYLLENILFCSSCFRKQQNIDRLEEEVASLRAKLNYRDKKDTGEFFGSSTPSSKEMFKKNRDGTREQTSGHTLIEQQTTLVCNKKTKKCEESK